MTVPDPHLQRRRPGAARELATVEAAMDPSHARAHAVFGTHLLEVSARSLAKTARRLESSANVLGIQVVENIERAGAACAFSAN